MSTRRHKADSQRAVLSNPSLSFSSSERGVISDDLRTSPSYEALRKIQHLRCSTFPTSSQPSPLSRQVSSSTSSSRQKAAVVRGRDYLSHRHQHDSSPSPTNNSFLKRSPPLRPPGRPREEGGEREREQQDAESGESGSDTARTDETAER